MRTLEVKLITEEAPLVIYSLLEIQLLVGCRDCRRFVFTIEAEYVEMTEVSKEMIWLQSLLTELGLKQEKNVLYSDSQSATHLAKNSTFYSRTKHIRLRYHFIRSLLEDEVLKLEKIQGSKNSTDMLTKTVTIEKLMLCSTSVGLQE